MSKLKVLVTIDVEEEGLFSGRYQSSNATVVNVLELSLLDPVFRGLDIRPTLLLTYQVAKYKPYHDHLLKLCEHWKGEIGAHLHPWNTPPHKKLQYRHPIPSQLYPKEILEAKLEALLTALAVMGVTARSFRMGRFNLAQKMFSILERSGIEVDSSIVPTRKQYGGPEYLFAPADPYFPDPKNPSIPGNSSILEIPVTIIPVIPNLHRMLDRLSSTFPRSVTLMSWISKNLGSIPAQPMMAPLSVLKTAVRMHHSRGGRVVTLYFHSSELLPGGCPEHRTKKDVDRFILKIGDFLSWLRNDLGAVSMTLTDFSAFFPASGKLKDHSRMSK